LKRTEREQRKRQLGILAGRILLTYRGRYNMSRHMRTTVRLDDALLGQAKREAGRRRVTLTALIEQGLRLVLAQSRTKSARKRAALPVSRARGGVLPGVDLNDSSALLDVMDRRR